MCNFTPSSQHETAIHPATLKALAELMRSYAKQHNLDLPKDLDIVFCHSCNADALVRTASEISNLKSQIVGPSDNTDADTNNYPSPEEFFYAQHSF